MSEHAHENYLFACAVAASTGCRCSLRRRNHAEGNVPDGSAARVTVLRTTLQGVSGVFFLPH